METTKEVGFILDRFQWTRSGRLHVEGSWSAIEDRSVSEPVLVVMTDEGVRSLAALPGVAANAHHWSALFSWNGDVATVRQAELRVGPDIVVELPAPAPDSGRRRFARTRLAVRRRAQVTELEPGEDAVALHAAVLAAREDAAKAEEESRAALDEAARANEIAESERLRRRKEVQRSSEALETLRRVADESLQEARAATRQLSAEVDELKMMLVDARDEINSLRQRLAVATEAETLLDKAQRETETLRGELANSRAAGEDAAQLRNELELARADSARAAAEAERIETRLEAVRRALTDEI